MKKQELNDVLSNNTYPGRGICLGVDESGEYAVIVYFIMGRSENSRNRVFDPVPERGGICTIAADPAKLEDPSLIIYNPVLTLGKTHIVTNGDQTDTIYDLMSQGKSFADALRTRTFEPDGPNYTPRISAVVYADGSYQMSILKSADGNGDSVQRYFFDYSQRVAGEGHFISTYKLNGNPIPSFEGEPLRFACPRTIGDFAHDTHLLLLLGQHTGEQQRQPQGFVPVGERTRNMLLFEVGFQPDAAEVVAAVLRMVDLRPEARPGPGQQRVEARAAGLQGQVDDPQRIGREETVEREAVGPDRGVVTLFAGVEPPLHGKFAAVGRECRSRRERPPVRPGGAAEPDQGRNRHAPPQDRVGEQRLEERKFPEVALEAG